MQARSALFDLYGDHLRPRGGRAPVAALVRLLAPLGIAAPAVRTAISRMVRQGWLLPVRLAGVYPRELGLAFLYGLMTALTFALYPLGRARNEHGWSPIFAVKRLPAGWPAPIWVR